MDTLHRVAHDDEQSGPIAFRELPECGHDPHMNPLLVGLSQAHHQEPLSKPRSRGRQSAPFSMICAD